jgi:hypothetical protein
MAHESIRDLIDAIVDENSVDSETVFQNIINDKLVDRIEQYRQDVANSFFNPEPVTEENSTEDTGEGEHGDGQFPSGQMDVWDGVEENSEESSEETSEETPPPESTPE